MSTYFYISAAVLALLLFVPASRLIWVLSVRRLRRKLGRELSPAEVEGQRARSRFIALVLVVMFSWLFNLQLMSPAGG